jgi:hypothetical protein|nr:MAG TPA: hypothetical protein [Caudoviricetes sp.]
MNHVDFDELEAKKKNDELLLKQQSEDFEWLMSDKRGRRIIRNLLEEAGVWRSTFSETPTIAAFKEGRRNMGLRLLNLIEQTPHFHLILSKESDNER